MPDMDLPDSLPEKRLDHIGIAVRNVDEAIQIYRDLLGLSVQSIQNVPSENVRVAKLETSNTIIELLEPIEDRGTIQSFLEKQGEGLHHICLETEQLQETMASLRKQGYEPIYETSKPGAEGRDINFLHPNDTHGVLIELQSYR